jgi:GT2 family glycosyltransferase
VSVIVPTYNGAGYLAEALESIAAQSIRDVEVIAVDDGSTDETIEILRSFADRFALKLIQQHHTGNWVPSVNCGMAVADGKYPSILHQDDRWLDDRLAVLQALVDHAAPPALVLHPVWYIDAEGKRVGLWQCPLPSGTMFAERQAIDRVGALDEDLWYTADWDLWLRLAASGTTFYCPTPLAEFRIHPQSQTTLRSTRLDEFRRQLEIVLKRHLELRGLSCPIRSDVCRAAWFSLEVNVHLAARAHGHRPDWTRLASRALTLGPRGWRRYWRDSRILERTAARFRSGMMTRAARQSQ